MNWRTAILGFLAIYCLAGLVYSWIMTPPGALSDGALFWGMGCIIFAVLSPLNEWVVRRLKRRAARSSDESKRPAPGA